MNIQVQFQDTKNGEQTIKLNDYYIHSKYNPSKEAAQIVEKNYTPHYTHIVFGYGCGYIVEQFKQQRQFNEMMLVIDPLFDDEVLVHPQSENNIVFLNSSCLVDFERYLSTFSEQARTSYKIICLANYDKLFLEQYKLLLSKVKDVQNRNLVNDYTVIRYAESWHKNFIENVVHLESDYSGNMLHKAYTEAAIIVSGGPSFSKQVPLLKQYRHQFIVICAGSTINSLIAEGIEPDYVVTIDGGKPNYRHFKDVQLENARIVYTMQNHPLVRNSFMKPGYAVELAGFPALAKYREKELKVDLPQFYGGASVAHVAFSFAAYITTGAIALIGQDVAYTDNLTHARTNKFAREIDEKFILKRQAFKVESYDGGEVWTTDNLNSMRLGFEDLIKVNPIDNLFYNCTEGGAKINGFAQIPFQQFCEQYAAKEPIHILEHDEPTHQDDSMSILKNELKKYDEFIVILEDALTALQKNKGHHEFDHKTLKKLEKADKKIKAVGDKLTIETLIAPVIMRVLKSYLPQVNETKEEAYRRSYAQMEDLYSSLLNKTKDAFTTLKEIIEKSEHNE